MSKYNIYVKYKENQVKVKYNDFNSLKSKVETKLSVSLNDHHLEYLDSARNTWIKICDDDDLEDVTEQTEVRLIPKTKGENI